MEFANLSLIGLVVVLWASAAVFYMASPRQSRLSRFELQRRRDSGDKAAKSSLERQKLLPRLLALKNMLMVLALGLAVVATVQLVGATSGGLIAAGLALAAPLAGRLRGLSRLAQAVWRRIEPKLLQLSAQFEWLKLFAENNTTSISKVASPQELGQLIDNSKSALGQSQVERLQAVLRFSELSVSQVMTPVDKLVTVPVSESLGPLVLDELHQTGHRSFPVVGQDINHVVGILNLDDVINLSAAKSSAQEAMERSVGAIDQHETLEQALAGFLRPTRHLFIVVDEQKNTVGALSLSDVISALLGQKIAS